MAEEAQRKKTLSDSMSAAAKILASGDCPLAETRSVLNGLGWARDRDPELNEAITLIKRLAPCREQVERAEAKVREVEAKTKRDQEVAHAAALLASREQWVVQAEKEMLRKGMDMNFLLSGSKKDLLTVKWILMSRVMVFQMTDDATMREGSFLWNLQKAGFRKVTFTDDHNYEVSYDLSK